MKKILNLLAVLGTIAGMLWLAMYALGLEGMSRAYGRWSAAILIASLGYFLYEYSENQPNDEQKIWFYPGDRVLVKHVSNRPLMKYAVGNEYTVDYFSELSREIWASNENDKDKCFKVGEVDLITRNPELRRLTEKAGKLPKIS